MPLVISGTNAKKYINWVGEHVNSPEQRLALGATALATQPFIDLNNKNVDEQTRSISVARTLAKIIAGTIVGVAVRHAAIKGIGACTKYEFLDKTAKIFKGIKPQSKYDFMTPNSNVIEVEPVEEFVKKYDNYVKAVGTFAATVVMIFTNFAIDAPLTRFLTGKFHNYIVGAQKSNSTENLNQEVSK